MLCVDVLLPLPFDAPFTYVVPGDWATDSITPGQVVQVPFGKRTLWGAALSGPRKKTTSDPPPSKLKPLLHRAPYILPAKQMDFLHKVARYTVTPLGSVLKMTLSCPAALDEHDKRLPQLDDFLKKADTPEPIILSGPQENTRDELLGLLKPQEAAPPKPVLLEGVTGSGKTEVYLDYLQKALNLGSKNRGTPKTKNPAAQSLILLPEIALTPQWCVRFKRRFGFDAVLWHSAQTPKQRALAYLAIVTGRAPVVVGARSALFLPYPNLKAIVVDEEHDPTFKQEDSPFYHARDMAVLKAHIARCPIILATATPAIETLYNVQEGKYNRVLLGARFQGSLPTPLTTPPPEHTKGQKRDDMPPIGQAMLDKLASVHRAGGQSMLLLNRRGFAPFVSCRSCHLPVFCTRCHARMVFHKKSDHLLCHLCGIQSEKVCPGCGGQAELALHGMGIEKLEIFLKEALPDLTLRCISSDNATPKRLAELVRELENKKIDLLVGTQIIAKGHHFPAIQFVGILDLDYAMDSIDFRAEERLFQMITQAGGRAGRSDDSPGEVWIQTSRADAPFVQALQKTTYSDWAAQALVERKTANLPPYYKMATVTLLGPVDSVVQQFAKKLAQRAPLETPDIRLIGPYPAPIPLVRGLYRHRFLLCAQKPKMLLQPFVQKWLGDVTPPFPCRMQIDIDPYSFM